jgi:hypothetical protein
MRDCPDQKVLFRATHTTVPAGGDGNSVQSHHLQQDNGVGNEAAQGGANYDTPYDPIDLKGAETQSFSWVSEDEAEDNGEYSDGQNFSMWAIQPAVNLLPFKPATKIGKWYLKS